MLVLVLVALLLMLVPPLSILVILTCKVPVGTDRHIQTAESPPLHFHITKGNPLQISECLVLSTGLFTFDMHATRENYYQVSDNAKAGLLVMEV